MTQFEIMHLCLLIHVFQTCYEVLDGVVLVLSLLDFEMVNLVMEEQAKIWASSLFGGATLQPVDSLASAITSFLETEESIVREGMHEMFTDDDVQIKRICSEWLDRRGVSAADYTVELLQTTSPTDGLFLSLSLAWANAHAGVLHSEGLWLSRADGLRAASNLLITLTKNGFCHMNCTAVNRKVELHDVPGAEEGWNMTLPVLKSGIVDLPAFLLTTKYEPKSDSIPQSVINILSNLIELSL